MSDESGMAESARLRVEFLEREVELTGTMIQHALLETTIEPGGADASQTIRHIHEGLDTIRKFLPEVTSSEDHARIAERLERLEADVAVLAGTARGATPKNPSPPRR